MLKNLVKILSHGKLTVLLFHKVPRNASLYAPNEISLAVFESVLDTVSSLFRIIPLDDAVLALRAGNLPDRAACITFDDGYPDWLDGVVPILLNRGAHATFFITSGQFMGLPMWNERILHAITRAPNGLKGFELQGSNLPLLLTNSATDKTNTVAALDRYLKYQEPLERENSLRALEAWAGVSVADVSTMPIEHLRILHSKGFAIGSHTISHPILTRCTEAVALQEMVDGREQLEAIIGGRVSAFAYPNGLPHTDFSSNHIDLVKKAGYVCAVTTDWGAAFSGTSVFQIPRFTPWGPTRSKMALQFARNLITKPASMGEHVAVQRPLKRALMVAFHFPPQAGSSGILRTLNFVKYLPSNGWDVSVLTASAHAYAEQRNDLVAAIPTRTRVVRAVSFDASRHFSVANKYPMTLALPDRWSSWWVFAVIAGMREIRHHKPDLIWSTYPIATAHLIGGTLARLSGLPWVADFRDPMVSAEYPVNKLQRKVWQKLEFFVIQNATTCVFTTQRAARLYGARYPSSAGKCLVIENGYDEDAFTGVVPNRYGTAENELLLLHSGLIYPKDRNPSTFFAAIQVLLESGRLDRNRLRIRFRAPYHEAEVRNFAVMFGLSDVVDIAPPLSYREAIAEMMGADLLLVFQGSYFNAQIPAKIYEYLRAQKPILAILDPLGDTAAQLRQFVGVHYGDIANSADIQTAILNWLCEKGAKNQLETAQQNADNVKKYSRIAQTKAFSELLNACSTQKVDL